MNFFFVLTDLNDVLSPFGKEVVIAIGKNDKQNTRRSTTVWIMNELERESLEVEQHKRPTKRDGEKLRGYLQHIRREVDKLEKLTWEV